MLFVCLTSFLIKSDVLISYSEFKQHLYQILFSSWVISWIETFYFYLSKKFQTAVPLILQYNFWALYPTLVLNKRVSIQ